MSALAWLVPAALALGALALAAFLWALHSGQFDDLDGAAWRAIADDERDVISPAATGLKEDPATDPVAVASSVQTEVAVRNEARAATPVSQRLPLERRRSSRP